MSEDDESANAPAAVRMEGVGKWFGTFRALKGIDLKVARGERGS